MENIANAVVLLATSPLMNMHNLKSALACDASFYHTPRTCLADMRHNTCIPVSRIKP